MSVVGADAVAAYLSGRRKMKSDMIVNIAEYLALSVTAFRRNVRDRSALPTAPHAAMCSPAFGDCTIIPSKTWACRVESEAPENARLLSLSMLLETLLAATCVVAHRRSPGGKSWGVPPASMYWDLISHFALLITPYIAHRADQYSAHKQQFSLAKVFGRVLLAKMSSQYAA